MRRLGVIALLALVGCGDPPDAERVLDRRAAAPVVTCRDGGPGAAPVKRRDAELGPLTVLFARRTVGEPRDAFDGHGWKLPVTLLSDVEATLSVPRRLRGRVGMVFTLRAQARVRRDGVRAADSSVRFEACAGDDAPTRTGWPGGIVVDRRRCAKLEVRIAGTDTTIARRIPLGRRCR